MAVAIIKAIYFRVLRKYRMLDYEAVFVTVPEFFRNIELTYKTGLTGTMKDRANDYMDLYHRAIEVDMLVLDEIGKEKMSAYRAQELYTLINARYNAMRPIISILNTAEGEDALGAIAHHVGGLHGDAIASRLVEMTPPEKIVYVGGRDRRVK
jgi:DNA replication protein DnaC